MTFLTRYMARVRREYQDQPKRLGAWGGGLTVLLVAASFALDALLPFGGWGNVARTLLMVPLSLVLFALLYAFGLFLHRARVRGDDQWVPYRMRMSAAWRLRASAVFLSFMFVLVYASGFRPGYTLMSSLFVVSVAFSAAFCRRTKKEVALEEMGIPDDRDLAHMQKVRRVSQSRRAQARLRRQSRE